MPLIVVSTIVRPSPVPLMRWTELPHPERGVATGVLVKVRHGVYASARLWNALSPWDRYLARVHAVAIMLPGAIFCCESAAVLLGVPIFGDPVFVHVLVEWSGTSRLAAGVRSHRASDDRTIIEVSGVALTAPADTAIDLARHRHPAVGRSAADAALRIDRALTRDVLMAGNEMRTSSRGRNIARWSLSRSAAQAETALESISLCVIEWLGFPEPELQISFPTKSGEVDRSDTFWRSLGIIGEADGDQKYEGRFGDPAAVLRRQHLRDRRLRSRAEVSTLVHWGWGDATAVRPLQQILLGAGLRPIAPEQSVPLHSLKRELSSRAPHRQKAASESARVHLTDEE